MRFLLLILPLFLCHSCFLLFPYDSNNAIQNLRIKYSSYTGLLGNENVEGTIENCGYATVYDIKIKATVHLNSGGTSVSEFTIEAGVPLSSTIAFRERIYVSDSNGKVDLCIIDGHF